MKTEDFYTTINGSRPVVVEFYASWCGPCKMMQPILNDLQANMGERIIVLKLDIDSAANTQLVHRYNIRSVPTLMIFRHGEVMWRQSGVVSSYKLEEMIIRFGDLAVPAPRES